MKLHYIVLLAVIPVCLIIGAMTYKGYQDSKPVAIDLTSVHLVAPGKLTVGTNVEFEPMEYYSETHEIIGFDIDVAKETAKRMGLTPVFVHFTWDDLFPAVTEKKVDIAISSITITPQRMKTMLFSHPYFDAGQALLVRRDETGIKKPEDLATKKAGAQSGTTGRDELAKYVDAKNLKEYATMDGTDTSGIIYDLKNGTIDAVVQDYVVSANIAKNDASVKLAGEPFTQEYYGIASAYGNETLITAINTVINDVKKSGVLVGLRNTWLH